MPLFPAVGASGGGIRSRCWGSLLIFVLCFKGRGGKGTFGFIQGEETELSVGVGQLVFGGEIVDNILMVATKEEEKLISFEGFIAVEASESPATGCKEVI